MKSYLESKTLWINVVGLMLTLGATTDFVVLGAIAQLIVKRDFMVIILVVNIVLLIINIGLRWEHKEDLILKLPWNVPKDPEPPKD